MTDHSLTRNDARAAFAATGISLLDLTEVEILDLRDRLDVALKASGLIGGTYRMRRFRPVWKGTIAFPWLQLTCRSRHFDQREAVTFNPDGFVGFAGWADDDNVAPILQGFVAWVGSLAERGKRVSEAA